MSKDKKKKLELVVNRKTGDKHIIRGISDHMSI